MKNNYFYIYTDGSCDNITSRKGGWCFIHIDESKKDSKIEDWLIKESFEKVENTSNNVMELKAILESLKYLKSIINFKNQDIKNIAIIRSDSQYAIRCLAFWFDNWERNNFKNSSGELVKNIEIIKESKTIMRELESNNVIVKLEHVKGHSGNKFNDYCDKKASYKSIEEKV